MHRNRGISMAAQMALVTLVSSGEALAEDARGYFDPHEASAMQISDATFLRWMERYARAPEDHVSLAMEHASQAVGWGSPFAKYLQPSQQVPQDLLMYMPYIGEERDQGSCGNCYAWAATGAMEIARAVHDNASPNDRLSVQYYNSCHVPTDPLEPGIPCCGGSLEEFADWYNDLSGSSKVAIPWEKAEWYDKHLSCESLQRTTKDCGALDTTTIQYPISSIGVQRIETGFFDADVNPRTAIARIKAAIDDKRPVILTINMGKDERYREFVYWWNNKTEADVLDLDAEHYCEVGPTEGIFGHTMLIVGYSGDYGDGYWNVLNSFGVTPDRRHGTLRLKMNMDYRCNIRGGAGRMFRTLDVQFSDGAPTKNFLMSSSMDIGASWQFEPEPVSRGPERTALLY
ncbi:C1 family peptidase [Sorangium sp. So ce136]|uniref:C1 family peptidase n=1 Tax=Sorangium sp. So ce136 TaxID=3133284 RepID=UPI003F0978D9